LRWRKGVRLTEPMPYLAFLGLMARARCVLTDSRGNQEETTALGVPCLTLRKNTERPVTVRQGTNRVIGDDPSRIETSVDEVLAGCWPTGVRPALWDGHAAERIVDRVRAWKPR
jgi:UDP-N-acetylglucosamine 2-epimerase (non-hydrolysing)